MREATAPSINPASRKPIEAVAKTPASRSYTEGPVAVGVA
jgi:hypothetical protein